MPVRQRRPGMGGVPPGIQHEDLAAQIGRLRDQRQHPGLVHILVQRVPGVELHRHRPAGIGPPRPAPVVQTPHRIVQRPAHEPDQRLRQPQRLAGRERMVQPPFVQPAGDRRRPRPQPRLHRPVARPQQRAQMDPLTPLQRDPGLELEAGLAAAAVQQQRGMPARMHRRLRLAPPFAGQRMHRPRPAAQRQPQAGGRRDRHRRPVAGMAQHGAAQQQPGRRIDIEALLADQRRPFGPQRDRQAPRVRPRPAIQPPGQAARPRPDLDHARQPGIQQHLVLAPTAPQRPRRGTARRPEMVADQGGGMQVDIQPQPVPEQRPGRPAGIVGHAQPRG